MIYCNICKAYNNEFTWYSDYIYDEGKAVGTSMTVCCPKCGSRDVKEVEL